MTKLGNLKFENKNDILEISFHFIVDLFDEMIQIK